MTRIPSRRAMLLATAIVCAAGAGLGGCAVTGVGVGYGEADYGGGFYEPYGYDYGGWGRGYRVGPPRGNYGGPRGGGPGRPYHAAPGGRSMPSIPGRSRGR